jgi:hypothetical protein
MSNICARTTRLVASVRERAMFVNLLIASSVSANSIACRHPRSANRKRGIREQSIGSLTSFTESVV